MRFLATLLTVAVFTATASAVTPDSKSAGPPAKPAPKGQMPPAPSGSSITGTVLETMNSGGYTYMKLKTDAGEVWSAVNQTRVQKGQTVAIASPVVMENFESKTLHKKFDRILFGTLAAATAKTATGAAAPSQEQLRAAMVAQHSAAATGPSDVGPIKVDKAPGGKTVAEIFAERAVLKDKEVAVRGKVVKFTPEVMGKNWIHLRDGSGSRDKKNDDITVTTAGAAAIGDIVLVRGVVHLDRDFGAGYTYSVIVEDAKLSK